MKQVSSETSLYHSGEAEVQLAATEQFLPLTWIRTDEVLDPKALVAGKKHYIKAHSMV